MKEDKKTKMKFNKMTVLTCLMIGLCFLWTGSAYIAWGRRIGFFYDERTYYLLTEAWGGYLPQIAGLVTFAFLIFKKPDIVFSYLFPVTVCILDGLLLVGCLLIPEGDLIITCGIIMNYFHGIVSGFYLAFLAMAVPKCHRGLTFGIGYAIGSIGTYLMSLPGNGNYLVQKSATVVYIALIALTALLLRSLLAVSQERIIRTSDAIRSNHITGADRTWLCRMLLFPAILIFLVTLLNQLIYVFPASAYLNGKISLEFSRAFYAVGLLIAGYLNDLDRRFGPLLCLLAFIFSLLSLGLYNESNATLFLAIMGFISLAFPIVYRVVAFLDTSDKKYIFLCISPMGLAIGRLGVLVRSVNSSQGMIF